MTNQSLTAKQIASITQAIELKEDLFSSVVPSFTAHQLALYEFSEDSHKDSVYWMWSQSVTFGFEVHWAILQLETPERLKELKAEGVDVDLPKNFDPHVPLNKLHLWAPQDHLRRV